MYITIVYVFHCVGGNILLLRLWEEKSGPYMQALHFSFAVGTFVAPLLAEPFITQNAIPDIPTSHYCNPQPDDTTNTTTNCTSINDTLMSNCTDSTDNSDFFSSIQFGLAYWISSFGMLLVAIPLIYFTACTKRRHPRLYQQIIAQKENVVATDKRRTAKANVKHYKMFWIFLVVICAVILFFYIGVEVTFGSFVFTFAVTYKELCFSKSKAALLNAVYWGSFTVGRLGGIGIAMLKVSTTIMLVSDFVGCMCAVLLVTILRKSDVVIWIGTALLGFAIASIFPSMLLWIDEHLEVTGKVTAVLVNGAALGDMVLLLTVGLLITNVNPEFFLYLTLVYCSAATLVYIITLVVSYLWRRYYPSSASVNPVHYEPLQESVSEETENIRITALSDTTINIQDAETTSEL